MNVRGFVLGFLAMVGLAVLTARADTDTYMVIDLSEGPDATSYPVEYYDEVPAGGWTDAYKTTKLVLRRIPAGTFMMGSPEDELGRESNEMQREVMLTQDFYMGVFPVTQKQWERVMGDWPSYFSNEDYRDARPVEQVNYFDIRENADSNSAISPNWPQSAEAGASSFVGRLRAKTGLTTLDLPTEAQWEYACRAGTATALNSGSNLTAMTSCPNMDEVGRYGENHPGGYSTSSSVSTDGGTAKVGSYLPNAWGLYDMHGNVWEWCLDWYTSSPPGTTDPVGAASGSSRVLRGGSWYSHARYCRSALRMNFTPDVRSFSIFLGFRLSKTLSPGSAEHTLTVVSGTGGDSYAEGTEVAVTADDAPGGYTFSHWRVEPSDADLGELFDAYSASTTLTMPDHDVTLTAQWEMDFYPADAVIVADRRATFYWLPVEGATWYQLVIRRNGLAHTSVWVEDARSWTPPADLAGGDYRWWVRSWGPETGMGAWSDGNDFVFSVAPAGAAEPIGPSGALGFGERQPVFNWHASEPAASWYQIHLNRNAGTYLSRWVEGATSWAPDNALPAGHYEWWVRGWNVDGMGPWSGGMHFSAPDPAPAQPTLVSPVGEVDPPVTLEYESERAEWYRVYVQRVGAGMVHDDWTQDTNVDLGALPAGDYAWWVGAWNAAGGCVVWSDRGDFSVR